MTGRIKEKVKASLVQRKIEEYYRDLDEQFVSYHDWITQREAQYRESMEATSTDTAASGMETKVRIVDLSGAENTPNAGEIAEGEILIFTTDQAFLDEHASDVICTYFSDYPECRIVYGDEDEWNSNRTIRMNPWLKPDFSPELLLNYFYFGNVIAVRRECAEAFLKDKKNVTAGDLYEFCLQEAFPAERGRIGHVPYVLYHAPCLNHLCTEEAYDELREKYAVKAISREKLNDKISVVIPSKDHPGILDICLKSLINTAADEIYEIIVVDNGSTAENREKIEEMKVKYKFNYIFEPMEFHFSKMCNIGAEHATGDFILFLNDDIEAMEEGWLSKMKQHAAGPHVGAVGAKLYYPDSKMIQHVGITNLRLGPVHKLQFLEDVRSYYDGRNQLDHNVIAVTGACLMVRREVLAECGGFSEDLAVAFNDVELCFRFYKKGYYNVVCNSVALYHHESLSRGNDESEEKQIRLWKERNKMYAMHPDLYGKDPFYHPYLNTVILDTNYSCAYEYPAGADVAMEEPVLLKGQVKEEWYNDCLQVSLEYAGELAAWMEGPDKTGDYLYFQGYQFVIGSENPEFARFLICREETTGQVWEIPCIPTFRPDLDKNVGEGHASLCGFGLVIEKKLLPKGRYRVGGMARSLISRRILCKFTNKYIVNI